jgi:CRISPR-associated endonuclease/helicase Cas3
VIPNAADILRDMPLDALASWGDEAVLALLRASISHHGRPVDESRHGGAHVWQPVRDPMSGRYDPAQTVSEMARCVVSLYPLAFTDGHPELPDRPAFVHLFGGLVQLADWLGSETQPGFFPYTEPGEDRAITAPDRARHAVKVLGLDVGHWRANVAQCLPLFSKVFQVEQPRPA